MSIRLKDDPEREQPRVDNGALFEAIEKLAQNVPDAEVAKVPEDASEQLDHYLYGTPKSARK